MADNDPGTPEVTVMSHPLLPKETFQQHVYHTVCRKNALQSDHTSKWRGNKIEHASYPMYIGQINSYFTIVKLSGGAFAWHGAQIYPNFAFLVSARVAAVSGPADKPGRLLALVMWFYPSILSLPRVNT